MADDTAAMGGFNC